MTNAMMQATAGAMTTVDEERAARVRELAARAQAEDPRARRRVEREAARAAELAARPMPEEARTPRWWPRTDGAAPPARGLEALACWALEHARDQLDEALFARVSRSGEVVDLAFGVVDARGGYCWDPTRTVGARRWRRAGLTRELLRGGPGAGALARRIERALEGR